MKLMHVWQRDLLLALVRLVAGAYPVWHCAAPTATQKLYFSNHTSHIDTLAILAALPRKLRDAVRPVAARDYWATGRIKRHIARNLLNAVLIDRRRETEGDPLDPVRDAARARPLDHHLPGRHARRRCAASSVQKRALSSGERVSGRGADARVSGEPSANHAERRYLANSAHLQGARRRERNTARRRRKSAVSRPDARRRDRARSISTSKLSYADFILESGRGRRGRADLRDADRRGARRARKGHERDHRQSEPAHPCLVGHDRGDGRRHRSRRQGDVRRLRAALVSRAARIHHAHADHRERSHHAVRRVLRRGAGAIRAARHRLVRHVFDLRAGASFSSRCRSSPRSRRTRASS